MHKQYDKNGIKWQPMVWKYPEKTRRKSAVSGIEGISNFTFFCIFWTFVVCMFHFVTRINP